MTRKANRSDFKAGNTLTTSEGFSFLLLNEYMTGVWEARGSSGVKLINEMYAETYTVSC